MTSRALRGCSFAVMLLGGMPAAQAWAQDAGALIGRPVTDIRIMSGGAEALEPQYVALLEIRRGEPLSMAAVRETIAHLMGLGRFLDVRVDASPVDGGVRVEIALLPLRQVSRVVFLGELGLAESVLRNAVKERFGAATPIGRAMDIARTLEELYADAGYLRAAVRPRPLDETGSGDIELTFDVACGPKARIRTVAYRGSPDTVVSALQKQLGLREGGDYEPAALRRRLDSYVGALRRGRYFEARADPFVTLDDTGGAVDLTITVTRGPLVSVEFRGDALPDRQRDTLVPVVREGTADEDLLEDSKRRIEDYLKAQGYRDARAPFTRTEQDDRLLVAFTVHRGPLYRVASVTILGSSTVPEVELRPLVKLAGGAPFVQARLDADMAALALAYRQRGYTGVTIEPTVAPSGSPIVSPERELAVTLIVSEGPRTQVDAVTLDGAVAVPQAGLLAAISSTRGAAYYEPTVEADLDRLRIEYLNRGFRMVTIRAEKTFSESRTQVHVRFVIVEGPKILVDHILVVGNRRISDATIRRELTLRPGEPLGQEAVNESQRHLSALGLFRRVAISELPHGPEGSRDVLITVDEAPASTIGYGGGVEFQKVETVEFAPRGFFEIGRRNLWGKNRSVNLFSRVSLRRRESQTPATAATPVPAASVTDLEYRVIGLYREPRFLNTRADLQLSMVFEQGSRTSFRYTRRWARMDVSKRFGGGWSVIGQYSFERDAIFDENINPVDRPLIDRLFPQVRLSILSTTAVRDTRDDALDPGRGTMLSLNGELALRPLGSEVGLAKTFLQGFVYRRLPTARRLVFAGGARLGLGTGFSRSVVVTGPDGTPMTGPDGQPVTVDVRDLPASERFFAGGDTTVRGFQLDRLGRPETFDRDGTPIGGHAEMILNGELRIPVWRDLGVVGFVDAGNVFGLVNDVRFGRLRGAAGFGIRYKSPVGPIRVDLGFKLGALQTFGTEREHRLGLHISIGQAF